jgi:S1-C subfamily serine protease
MINPIGGSQAWAVVPGCRVLMLCLFAIQPVAALAQTNDTRVRIVNRSPQAIHYLFASPTDSGQWGEDRLRDGTIASGSAFTLDPGTAHGCAYDVRIVYADKQSEERRNQNLCMLSELIFDRGGIGHAPEASGAVDTRFDIVNRTSHAILHVYVSASSAEQWGEDRLGSAVLPAGGRFRVDPGPANGCIYDVRVAFANMEAEERRQQNLCAISELAFDGSPAGAAPDAGSGGRSTGQLSFGTAFFVTASGYALTNDHVVEDCRSLVAYTDRGPLPAHVARRDGTNDLALLRVRTNGSVPHASFRASPGIRPGDSIAALGFPLQQVLQNGLNVTVGNVSSLAGLGGNTALLQITAPIQPGNSGGPLFDMSGNVVGVIVSKLNSEASQNVNFAVQGSIARLFVEAEGHRAAERPSVTSMAVSDVVDAARAFTFQVECRQ